MAESRIESTYFSDEIIERVGCASGRAIPFGLKDGKLVSVAEVDRGLACGCLCPDCESVLEAVKGDSPRSRRHHFRHHNRDGCDGGLETGLHMLAKEVLAKSQSLVIPNAIARHGTFEPRLVRRGRELSYDISAVEATQNASGAQRLRPDLIVEGTLGVEPFKLFVEIFVRHKTDQKKIAKLKERGAAAIEIDLSRVPADETRGYYEDAILRTAERRWLHNRYVEEEQRKMREEAELRYSCIAEKIAATLDEAEASEPDNWTGPVIDAGLAELVALDIDGHRCFATTNEIWQAAILHRHVLSDEPMFRTGDTLRWLAEQDLLRSAFLPLLEADEGRLAHLKDCFPGFRAPQQVVSDYAGELVRRGVLQKRRGKRGWDVSAPIASAAVSRGREVVHWRLRLGVLLREFQAIRNLAMQGWRMDWDTWRRMPLSAYGGETPEDIVQASKDRFQTLAAHLSDLLAMLEPGGATPSAGLLGLPLEPEWSARVAELREATERAARVEAEQRARSAEAAQRREEAKRSMEAPGGGASGSESLATLKQQLIGRNGRAPQRKQRWLDQGLGLLRKLMRRRA